MWGSPRAPRACNKTKILTVVRELLTTVVALGPLRDMPHFLFINLNGLNRQIVIKGVAKPTAQALD